MSSRGLYGRAIIVLVSSNGGSILTSYGFMLTFLLLCPPIVKV